MNASVRRIASHFRLALVPYVFDALLGAILAWPVYGVVRAAYGGHPRGDAVLFEGDLELAELIDGGGAYAEGYLPLLAIVLAFGWVLGHLIKGVVLARAAGTTKAGLAIGTAVHQFRRMTLVSLTALVLQAIVVGGLGWSAGRIVDAATITTERRQHLLAAAVVLVALAFAVLLGIAKDYVHGRLIGRGDSLFECLRPLRRPRAILIALFPAWFGYQAVLPLSALVLAGIVATAVGTGTGSAIALVAVSHQLASFARSTGYVSYLKRVVRVVGEDDVREVSG